MKYICTKCNKEFLSSKSYAAHCSHHNRDKTSEIETKKRKGIESRKLRLENEYKFWLENKRFCPYCEKEISFEKRNNKFCSANCAVSNSNLGIQRNKNKKLVIINKKSIKQLIKQICTICNNEFEFKNLRKTCSTKCGAIQAGLSNRGNKFKQTSLNKSEGLREKGGKVKKYFYIYDSFNNQACLNADELKIAELLNELKIIWRRNLNGFEYETKDGKLRKYYPDFYLPIFDLYVEYKGWVIEEMHYKMQQSQLRNKFKLLIICADKYKQYGITVEDFKNNFPICHKISPCRSTGRTLDF